MSKFYKPAQGAANRQQMLAFGQYVRDLRLARDLTQAQVGKLVGVTNNHISDIENGVRKLSPERYAQFAQVFEIPPRDFALCILQHYDPHAHAMLTGPVA